jgi:LPS-assembly protein
MRSWWFISLVGAIWLMVLSPAAVLAQGREVEVRPKPTAPALLVADRVFITPDRKLIAEGNVEAFQGDIRLTASRITFDRDRDLLTIEGPIRIDQGDSIILLADSAELDKGLQNGILTGARLVLDEQLQLAALQMTRVGGQYSQLYTTAVTSCQVCGADKAPLWQIRARKVIHDQEARQIYFEGAQFRILDVPVFYLPYMRLPDPTLERATGLLVPSVRTTSQLGTGLILPYFIRLGDNRDLTVTPYVSSKTRTLGLRYRQAFRTGRIEFEGAYTRDDLMPGEGRGYVFGTGYFNLPRDFKLKFDIKTVSDNAYLVDYGLPDLDRLKSEIALQRIRRDAIFQVGVIHYKSLRDSENDTLIPSPIADAFMQRRYFPAGTGGEVRVGLSLRGHQRTSSVDILGRDVASATVDVDWRRDWILPRGLRADWQMGIAADTFSVTDDSTYPARVSGLTPRMAATLRLPMTRVMPGGATQFLEPVAQLGWSDANIDDVPNDQSGFVEFDQGNLLSLSRFPAYDRRESGPTFVYGLNWARYAPEGWQAAATIGQIFRQNADPDFTSSSGLSGTSSDILLAGQLKLRQGLALTGRGLLNNSLAFSKAELRGDWDYKRVDLSSSYIWLARDLAEGRPDPVSEIWFDGSYEVSRRWSASANLRYDTYDSRATTAGLGLVYRNECVKVDISLNRRYTSSTSVEPSTDFGFTISLNGFSVDTGAKSYRQPCNS